MMHQCQRPHPFPGAALRPIAALLILLTGTLEAPATALAQDGDAVRGVLQDRYKTLHAAMVADDRRLLGAVLASDYVGIDVSGHHSDGKELLNDATAMPIDPHALVSTTISSVREDGGAAIVRVRLDIKSTEPNCGGINERVEYVTFSTDTWINANGTWLLQKSQIERLEYYVNGRQVADNVQPQ